MAAGFGKPINIVFYIVFVPSDGQNLVVAVVVVVGGGWYGGAAA